MEVDEKSKAGAGPVRRPMHRRVLRATAMLLGGAAMLLLGAWATGAIYYSNLPIAWLRAVLAAAFAIGFALAFIVLRRRRRRTATVFVACCAAVAAWFLLIPPPRHGRRDYAPDTAVMPRAHFDGTRVTVRNVRNFRYRSLTDFDVSYEDRTYDLHRVRTADLFVSDWDSRRRLAHTFVSFGFDDGRYLAVSIEVRRPRGRQYHPIPGLFKQYELIYLWGDERDLIGVRTGHRGEDVYLYRTTCTPQEARLVLADMLRQTEALALRPAYYNTITRNCTTAIIGHVNRVLPRKIPLWRRRLLNGYSDERAFASGWIASDVDFATTRERARITDRARAAETSPDFSDRIRTHLPPRPEHAGVAAAPAVKR